MAKLQEPFVIMLREQLYTERELVDTLPKLISETGDRELKTNLEHHLEETREHVRRLEQVFEAIGQDANPKKSAVMNSLKKVHGELSKEAGDDLRDIVVASAAASTEHYEISVYEAAICVAKALGESRVERLLKQNLEQEQQALEHAREAVEKLTMQHATALTA